MTPRNVIGLAVTASVWAVIAAAPALAGKTGCEGFKWPVVKEQAAFATQELPSIEAGAARGAWVAQAFALKLKPEAEAGLPTAPSGTPMKKPDKPFAGSVTFDAPKAPGPYRVTLSAAAWIDLVQDGKQLPSAAHTGGRGCPGVRKSVRFELIGAPIVLQISGASEDAIKVAIVPAAD